jgi:hypothetical protein
MLRRRDNYKLQAVDYSAAVEYSPAHEQWHEQVQMHNNISWVRTIYKATPARLHTLLSLTLPDSVSLVPPSLSRPLCVRRRSLPPWPLRSYHGSLTVTPVLEQCPRFPPAAESGLAAWLVQNGVVCTSTIAWEPALESALLWCGCCRLAWEALPMLLGRQRCSDRRDEEIAESLRARLLGMHTQSHHCS